MDIEKILHEIDERHQFSNEALVQKRFDDYINIFSDNLFAFKHGNYLYVFMPLWGLGFYYLICYIVGIATQKPKWLA